MRELRKGEGGKNSRLGERAQLHSCCGNDAKRPFSANKQLSQFRTDRMAWHGGGMDQHPGWSNKLQAQHMLFDLPVLGREHARTTGRNTSTNGGPFRRGWIVRERQAALV